MVAEIMRVPTEDEWEQASLPVKFAGLGVNQTKVIAGSDRALRQDASSYEPAGVSELLSAHETATGITHDFPSLSAKQSVQKLLSTERHEATFGRLKGKLSVRSHNLLLACSMPHASDWLLAPPIPGLGLGLQSDVFRTALKFRLSRPLFSEPYPCPALSRRGGTVCDDTMDVFGDHALCCHNSTSLVFRHNNIRDILGHSARAAGGRD